MAGEEVGNGTGGDQSYRLFSDERVTPTYGAMERCTSAPEKLFNSEKKFRSFSRALNNAILDYKAHALVVLRHLLSLDMILYCIVVTASTLSFHVFGSATSLSWTFFSLMVVFPITWNISQAYNRRERALSALALFRSALFNIYLAHRDWTSTNETPQRTPSLDADYMPPTSEHDENVREILIVLSNLVKDFLLIPCFNDSRHLYTAVGSAERGQLRPLFQEFVRRVQLQFHRLSLATEVLKAKGLPATEASRVNQYNMILHQQFEVMRTIKGYRTPEGIRAFARLFIFIHAVFYGSYYAALAKVTSLVYSLCFAWLLGGTMIALLNVEVALEDPFDPRGLDNVRVEKKFNELQRMLLFSGLRDSVLPWSDNGLCACKADTSEVVLPESNGVPYGNLNVEDLSDIRARVLVSQSFLTM